MLQRRRIDDDDADAAYGCQEAQNKRKKKEGLLASIKMTKN